MFIDDPDFWLESILIALNDENAIRRGEMRRLFEAWRNSDHDIRKLLAATPELNEYVADPSGKPAWSMALMPEGSGFRGVLICFGPNRGMTKEELVLMEPRMMFMHFLMNPLREKILGPCAWKNCRKYFIQKRAKRTEYCSRTCCQLSSATSFRIKQLKDEKEDKLKRAAAAARKWRTDRTRDDWKAYVCRCEPDITPKFLTRAVTDQKLVAPTKGR